MGLSVGGLDPDRLPTCGDRLVELALPTQCPAEVRMGLSVGGLDPDRLATCGDRLVELALPTQCTAEVRMGLSKIRLRC